MSLQYHWEDRFLNRQDPWILKPQRDHLENLTEDLQSALNCLSCDPKQGVAALTQRILHPFCYLITCCPETRQPALASQGAAATAERLLGWATERPGRRALAAVALYRVRDCRDSQVCIVQETRMSVLGGGCCDPCRLSLIWKPMTNGEWRLFVFAATAADSDTEGLLGFKRVLDL